MAPIAGVRLWFQVNSDAFEWRIIYLWGGIGSLVTAYGVLSSLSSMVCSAMCNKVPTYRDMKETVVPIYARWWYVAASGVVAKHVTVLCQVVLWYLDVAPRQARVLCQIIWCQGVVRMRMRVSFTFLSIKIFFFFVACDSRNNAFVHRPGAPLERHATERSEAVAWG